MTKRNKLYQDEELIEAVKKYNNGMKMRDGVLQHPSLPERTILLRIKEKKKEEKREDLSRIENIQE
jgi:hypothetical protein